ncbi:TPA: hypothetical protein HA278_05055, partial [Candidatus Woesearchaeota archaeon]|nr:hypothetical protein [Candidatus Woesearchaeota archaeon]
VLTFAHKLMSFVLRIIFWGLLVSFVLVLVFGISWTQVFDWASGVVLWAF